MRASAAFSFLSVCLLLLACAASAFILLFTNGCQKQGAETEPQEKTYSVTYKIYSAHTKFLFGHCEDNVGHVGAVDSIATNSYTVTKQVKENALEFYQYVQSISAYASDSLFISAEYDGKKIDAHYAYPTNGSIFSVSIQLSAAK